MALSKRSRMALLLVALSMRQTVAQEFCSVDLIASDTCEYKYDGECDSGTLYCSEETDCFDCDPCRVHRNDCDACTANPICGFCTLASGAGVCLSMGYLEFMPGLCSEDGGTEWVTRSSQCEAQPEQTCDRSVCPYEYDAECDVGLFCPSNTDCFDCDPCQLFASSCEGCSSEDGCQYGILEVPLLFGLGISQGVCSSSTNAAAALADGSVDITYVDSCNDINSTPAASPSIPQPPTPALDYTCDTTGDACVYQLDGECDAGTVFCRRGSDCLDCDPCMAHRFNGCSACTAAGCSWCAADAMCVSSSLDVTAFPSSLAMCSSPSDYVESCEDNGQEEDPLFDSQSWLFDLINVQEAWDMGYTGRGIGIRVNDDGVDHTHAEFEGKFDVDSSCSRFRPASLNGKNGHGTAVASLAAGNFQNGVCGTGIAYHASLSGCRIINSDDSDDVAPEILDSSVLYDSMDNMHVSQNSYGVPTCTLSRRRRNLQASCPFNDNDVCNDCRNVDWSDPAPNAECEESIADYCKSSLNSEESPSACFGYLDLFTSCDYNGLSASEQAGFQRGAREGRDGKGIVYIFASGNEHHAGADVNFEGVLTSRYTLSVGAVGKDGLHASYSTGGAALLVVAPGGDLDHYTNNLVASPGAGCHNIGPGTSFAAPIVSGVVALILQANDDLSWRDVHAILATTAKVVEPNHESWSTNGAGLQHSDLYGFGLVDAGAAVKAALAWDLYSEEQQVVVGSGEVEVDIPEYPNAGIESAVEVDSGIVVEAVNVYLDLKHSSRGDLEIVLVSPSGTESVLHPSRRPENSVDERWKLLTVKHWGEPAEGTWKLKMIDHREGNLEDCVDRVWKVEAEGIEIGCGLLERALACEDGGEGSQFDNIFTGLSLNSAALQSTDRVSPAEACCACGGGSSPDDIQNALHSWQLVVFGHSGTGGTSQSTALPGSNSGGTLPTAQVASSPSSNIVEQTPGRAPIDDSTLGEPPVEVRDISAAVAHMSTTFVGVCLAIAIVMQR